MFRIKESEFQYSPGIETILEDIIGGGTIARADVKGIVDELPPLCKCPIFISDIQYIFFIIHL